LTCSSAEGDKYQIKEGFRIVVPGHYPTEEEKIEINNVIANGGWFRPYINTRIDAQDGDFGPNTTGNTIQSVINFSSEVHNLYNVIILSAHEHSHVVYDKPKISDIEVNASELWKLANEGTHVDPTYDGDTDMYQDLLNGFGTQTFKNLERFDDSITHDYLTKYTDNDLWVKVSFKLTISLNDTNDGFKDVTSGSSTYTPVDFKILNREIVTKKYRSVDSSITSQSEIDKVSHTKTMYGFVFIKNNSTSSNIYTNKQINFYCDSTDPKNKFNFTGGTVVSNSSTSVDVTNEGTIKASVSEVSGDKTVKRFIAMMIGFKNIKKGDLPEKVVDNNMFGSYLQFYKFAPTNQLGYSADYFTSLINFKYKNCYSSYQTELAGAKYDFNLSQNNYDSSTMFCCCQSLSFLVFKEGGIDIVNPYSEDLDIRFQMNNINSYCGNGHGLGSFVPGLFSPITNLIGKGINGLRNIIKENRSHSNNTYAYSTLGKDNYEKHKDIINSNSTMKRNKFKKFINGLYQMENSVQAHGINNPGEEIAEFATFDDLNLKPFVQTYPAELADYEYKNQLILDYKNRFNLEKLRLNSFGSEAAMDGNNYHGRVGDWFRRIGNKFRGWFKSDGKRIIKNIGSDLSNIANEYAAKIATGEISISDIKNLKPQLKSQILNIVRNSDKGT
ncbi:hypothetical protein, partial [Methanobrevibacter sp.]|uniref:hypothetical protein n=1 Tax=Methanobrevibacter sp. TaxID=66852 RepID=UPI003D7DD858